MLPSNHADCGGLTTCLPTKQSSYYTLHCELCLLAILGQDDHCSNE